MSANKKTLSKTIILAGSGRSGTTWLGNIIAANPNIDIVFEPFDHRRVPEAECLPLLAYARKDGEYPEWEGFVEQALTNQIQNEWTTQQRRRLSFLANRWLVKAIRINHMLGWIEKQFNPQIVFTIRHPCAVILSRIKLDWDPHLDIFLRQAELVEDYLHPYLDIIKKAQTDIERQAVAWCIENLVPLKQLKKHNWLFCTYEQLYQNPQQETDRLLSELGIRQTWFTKRELNRVSMVTRPDSALHNQRDPLSEWQRQLSPEEVRTILDTVSAFDITLYDDAPLPHLETEPTLFV